MRVHASLLGAGIAAAVTSAAARGLFSATQQDLASNDELIVPGNSPLKFCTADRSKDLVIIEQVDLTPNPPEAGETLVVTATGTVKKQIEEGAYVLLVVKYGYIYLLKTKADLCDTMKNVDITCPIEKGRITLTKMVDLPEKIPPGKYNVHADLYTADDVHISCLDAEVTFTRKSVAAMFDL